MVRKSTDIVPNMIRMRESLRRKIEAAATKNDVSMNEEMVARLEASFDAESEATTMQGAIAALVGGDDEAKLLRMIASAMQLAKVSDTTRKLPVEDRMEIVAAATRVLMAAMVGHPLKQYTADDVAKMSAPESRGLALAQVILEANDMPPPVAMSTQRQTKSALQMLMEGVPGK